MQVDWALIKRPDRPPYLEPFYNIDKTKRKPKTEYITKLKTIRWGEKHGVLLDLKGRIFTMGDSNKGKLGIPEENLPE